MLRGLKKVLKKIAEAQPSSSDQIESSEVDDTYNELVEKCIQISNEEGTFVPGLSREQLEEISFLEDLTNEKRRRDMTCAKGEEVQLTKILTFHRMGKGVVLEWHNRQPVGLGKWPSYFVRYIGNLVRNHQEWNVGFTFAKNSYRAISWTWMSLQKHYVLEVDDPIEYNKRFAFVRTKMNLCFRQYHNRLKTNFEKPPFEENWQRICGLPSTIERDQFAYLIKHWESGEGKEEAARNKANRRKAESDYIVARPPLSKYNALQRKLEQKPVLMS